MKKYFFPLVLSAIFTSNIEAQEFASTLTFIENKGQVHDQNNQPRPDVLFSGSDGQLNFHLLKDGISYQTCRVDSWKESEEPQEHPGVSGVTKSPDQMTIYRIDVKWLNANANPQIKKSDPRADYTNYYTTACGNGVTHVNSFSALTYLNLYPGIDLKWYESNGHLKYDYIVAAGADFHQIAFRYDGASSLTINAQGELVISTPLGELIEQAPLVTQGKNALPAKWVINDSIVTLAITGADPLLEMIIDPIVRVWGTYYGGAADDVGQGLAIDSAGNIYQIGSTTSTTLIATVGAFQTSIGGDRDVFIAKFSTTGALVWATYYGGSQADEAIQGSTDIGNEITIGGQTSSPNLIVPGAFQPALSGANDMFAAHFDTNGLLEWASYCGGTANDFGRGNCSDATGNFYMTGLVASTNFPVVAGYDMTYNGGSYDAVVVKISPTGVLLWATYLGGSSQDDILGCGADASGNVYIAGYTQSSNFPVVAGFDMSYSGSTDGFICKFNSAGALGWSTFAGGNASDAMRDCVADSSGNIYVVGYTQSTDFPTLNAHDATANGSNDCVAMKLSATCTLIWSTYLGGSSTDQPFTCSLDTLQGLLVVGGIHSSDFPVTPGAFQTTYAGNFDGFLSQFTSAGVLSYSTYYGGANNDDVWGCVVDTLGNIFIGGITYSTSGIATAGAYQTTFLGGPRDAFLAKLSDCVSVTAGLITQSNVSCSGGSNGTASVTASGGSSFTYAWAPFGGNAATGTGLSAGTYTCTITNECTSSTIVTVTITEPTPLILNTGTRIDVSCYGGADGGASVIASGGVGGNTFDWSPGNPVGDGTNTISSLLPGTYTCIVTNTNGCTASQTMLVTEPLAILPNPTQTDVACNGASSGIATVTPQNGVGLLSYAWTPSVGNTASVSNLTAGNYAVVITDANGCSSSQTFLITEPSAISPNQMQNNITCAGGPSGHLMVSPSGGTGSYTYAWSPLANSTNVLNGSPAGFYTCTITDANACTATATFELTEPPALATTTAQTDILCNGNATGDATVTVSGGTPGYTYAWLPAGGNGAIASALTAGTYSCVITDLFGCSTTATVSITEPLPFTPSAAYTNVTCAGGNDGVIDITVTGGTMPYTYDWNNGQFTTEDISGLTAGIYTIVVTDVNGCMVTGTLACAEPAPIAHNAVVTDASGCTTNDGIIDLTSQGGTGPFTFLWNNAATTEDISGLDGGIYSVVITDSNNCTLSVSFTITEPSAPNVTYSEPIDTACGGTLPTPAFTLSGESPLGGTWSGPGVTGSMFDAAAANIGFNVINYTFTDVNGCSASATDSIWVDLCLDVASLADNTFMFYPNPTAGILNIITNGDYATILVTDALGQQVTSVVTNSGTTQVDLSDCANGMYFVRVEQNGTYTTKRVMVAK